MLGRVHQRSILLWWIIAFKIAKAALLIALGVFLLDYLHRGPLAAVITLARAIHLSTDSQLFDRAVSLAMDATPARQAALGVTALGYAVIFLIEAVGLSRRRAWARWFTIGVTASLLPIEVFEIVKRPDEIVRIATLLVNIAIVIYLYRRKDVFEP